MFQVSFSCCRANCNILVISSGTVNGNSNSLMMMMVVDVHSIANFRRRAPNLTIHLSVCDNR